MDYINAGNIYPTANRNLGEEYSGFGRGAPAEAVAIETATPADAAIAKSLVVGNQSNAAVGLLVFGAMAGGIMLLANHLGEAGEFSNLRASAYNVLLISLVAVAGIPVWKFIFVRFPVPGVSTWVQAV